MNKEVEEYEEKSKKLFFDKMQKVYLKLANEIEIIKENSKCFFNEEFEIPNIGITTNNKIVELLHEFRESEISLFASEIEKTKSVSSSFIGDSIFNDVFNELDIGAKTIKQYNNSMEEIIIKKVKDNVKKEKKTFKNRLINKNNKNNKVIEISVTKNELNEILELYNQYKDINDKIWNYNLKDNIIDSLVKNFRANSYRPSVVPALVENIVPELKKLGLEDLVPELKQELINEYKKDLPKNFKEDTPQGVIDLFVPNFNKNENKNENKKENESKEKEER